LWYDGDFSFAVAFSRQNAIFESVFYEISINEEENSD
jgi:hypothetical protein